MAPDRVERAAGLGALVLPGFGLAALLIAGFFTFPFGRLLGRWLFG